jgi:hypothetical protein
MSGLLFGKIDTISACDIRNKTGDGSVRVFASLERQTGHRRLLNRPRWLTAVALCVALAGCVDRLPSGIGCESVRNMQVGMSQAQVLGSFGPAMWIVPGVDVARPASTRWYYQQGSSGFGKLRFYVEFEGDALTKAVSFYEQFWESRPTVLLKLDHDGRTEGVEFSRYFACSK